MSFDDKTLHCRECSKPFLWTAGEQAFYKERGLVNVPARCPECRARRNEKLGMRTHECVEVTCARCEQTTTVPFVPRNGKPIYCSTCYVDMRNQEAANKAHAAETLL